MPILGYSNLVIWRSNTFSSLKKKIKKLLSFPFPPPFFFLSQCQSYPSFCPYSGLSFGIFAHSIGSSVWPHCHLCSIPVSAHIQGSVSAFSPIQLGHRFGFIAIYTTSQSLPIFRVQFRHFRPFNWIIGLASLPFAQHLSLCPYSGFSFGIFPHSIGSSVWLRCHLYSIPISAHFPGSVSAFSPIYLSYWFGRHFAPCPFCFSPFWTLLGHASSLFSLKAPPLHLNNGSHYGPAFSLFFLI